MKADRIPLFPLEVVLFPGMVLPLHIFEPRYKLMIGRCLESKLKFGVVLTRSEGIAQLGCTAEIVKLVKRYPDGRMDILTVGQARCRLLEVFEDQPYLEAEVEYVDDDPGPAPPETQQELLELYDQCHTLIYHRAPQLPDPSAGAMLAFQIAGELPLDLAYKQELLEMGTEGERQTSLLKRMNLWLPELERMDHIRRKAAGNGRGRR